MIAKIAALLASLISVGACAQGPYVLTLPLPAKRLGCWTSHFAEHNEIVGYSSLVQKAVLDDEGVLGRRPAAGPCR
jgi:hypothetical protein